MGVTVTTTLLDIAALGGRVPSDGGSISVQPYRPELGDIGILTSKSFSRSAGTPFILDPGDVYLIRPSKVPGMLGEEWIVRAPDVETIALSVLVRDHRVDPANLDPLLPLPPSAIDILEDAEAAVTAAAAASTEAGQKAFNAGQSAAVALGHANAAQASAGDAVAAQTGAQAARTGAETAQTGAQAARTGAETARTGAETAQTGANSAKTAAETARDLALAGQFVGSPVADAGVDLNTLITPGVYRIGGTASGTSTNMPSPIPGVLEVFTPATSSNVLQRFMAWSSSVNVARGTWLRRRLGSGTTWSPWYFTPVQRIDNPTGQPGVGVLTWDDVNSREQALLPTSIQLGTTDLDLVTYPGQYFQSSAANATVAAHYPKANVATQLEVLQASTSGTIVVQRVTIAGGVHAGKGFYERRLNGSWSAWAFLASHRVDETAGRAIYTWDDLNGRDQLLYGDTGMRNVTTLFAAVAAGNIYLSRVGGIVTLTFEAATLGATVQWVGALPAAFRPRGTEYGFAAGLSTRYVTVNGSTGTVTINSGVSGDVIRASLSWRTDQPWPTALPGIASGSVPNA